jgi:hypothetical protein
MLRFDLAKGDDALVQKLDAPVDGIVTDGTYSSIDERIFYSRSSSSPRASDYLRSAQA